MPLQSLNPLGDLIEKEIANVRAGLPPHARTDWSEIDRVESEPEPEPEDEPSADDLIKAGY